MPTPTPTPTPTPAPGPAKVTGGGFIDDALRTSFGFVVRSDGPVRAIQFELHAGADRFHADSLTNLSVTGTHATWTALGAWNGTQGYRLTVEVVDVGPPSKQIHDSIRIRIEAPNGSTVFSTSGRLLGGNILIH